MSFAQVINAKAAGNRAAKDEYYDRLIQTLSAGQGGTNCDLIQISTNEVTTPDHRAAMDSEMDTICWEAWAVVKDDRLMGYMIGDQSADLYGIEVLSLGEAFWTEADSPSDATSNLIGRSL